MEDSIRRAQKLVYSTNSALAQMKYNLTFADYEKESRGLMVPDKGTKNLYLDEELQKYEEDFKVEANQMLSKMDKMLDPSQYSLSRKPSQTSKIRERMKEINFTLSDRCLGQKNFRETEQSRLKLLSLINQQDIKLPHNPYMKPISSSNNSETYKNTGSTITNAGTQNVRKNSILRKTDSLPTIIGKSLNKMKPNEELKNKLLETQEIVDRGFETARHLKHKVESLTNLEKKLEKTPSTVKTFFSENMTTTKSLDSIRKSESNETVKLNKTHRCRKHQQKEKRGGEYSDDQKKISKEIVKDREEKPVIEKNSLISIKRAEGNQLKYFKFNFQRLPSLNIKGGLQIQRIHSLEILPKNLEGERHTDNIGIKIISHEEMEREKINKIVENIETENCFCPKKIYTNRIECFNCGKLNRVDENFVDPKEIDNLLIKCRFNVFDPRIDEFVEKYKRSKKIDNFMPEELKSSEENIKQPELEKTKESRYFEEETEGKSIEKDIEIEKALKIQELSEELTHAYKEKASQLEDDYEEFENILRGLFRKIDKSRRIFENFDNCNITSLDSKENKIPERIQKFTKTKPVIISVPDNEDPKKDLKTMTETESDSEKNSPKLNKQFHKKPVFRKKESRKSSSKKDNKHDLKDKILQKSYKNIILEKFILETNALGEEKKEEQEAELQIKPIVCPLEIVSPVLSVASPKSEKNKTNKKGILEVEAKSLENQFGLSEISCTESIIDVKFDNTLSTENDDMKTENDYESDFEGESIKNEDSKSLEGDKTEEENEDVIKCMKKLSTILEVDSEAEKKISEVEFTNSSKENSIKITVEESSERLPIFSVRENQLISQVNSLNQKLEMNSTFTINTYKEVDIFETILDREGFSNLSPSPKTNSENTKVREKSKNLENCEKSDFQTESVSQNISQRPSNPSPTKNNSSTMVTALKEVLSALQDQFYKTQSLAEKLTENVNSKEKANPSEVKPLKNQTETLSASSPVIREINLSSKALLSNLQNNRKNLDNDSDQRNKSPRLLSTVLEDQFRSLKFPNMEVKDNDVTHKNISKSPLLGNIELDNLNSVSTRKMKERRQSESSSTSDSSFVKLPMSSSRRETSSKPGSAKSGTYEKVNNLSPLALFIDRENISYSEGEIINPDNLENDSSSTQSIGEVISERISEGSL